MLLYPIEFIPTFHYRIWAGNSMKNTLGKKILDEKIGESWEISSVENFVSVVKKGSLAGKTLLELIQIYREELLGSKVWEKYGEIFPLLIKFIDTAEPLSVQVHPDDDYAKKNHNSFGKTEMWYIMQAEKQAELIIGFKENTTQEIYENNLANNSLEKILRKVTVQKEDAFLIPAKRVHAIGKGILLAEIQQTSDITYRIYDFNRVDKDGKARELHTKQALEVADFSYIKNPKILYDNTLGIPNPLVESDFFTTQKWIIKTVVIPNFTKESFTILIGIEGKAIVKQKDNTEIYLLSKGKVLLLPACIEIEKIMPKNKAVFLAINI